MEGSASRPNPKGIFQTPLNLLHLVNQSGRPPRALAGGELVVGDKYREAIPYSQSAATSALFSPAAIVVVSSKAHAAGRKSGAATRDADLNPSNMTGESVMRRRPFGALLVGASALLRESVARLLTSIQFRILSSSPRLDLNLIDALPKDQSILLVVEASTAFALAIEQIALFRAHHDAGRIIVLTDRRDPSDLAAVFKAGAQACLDSGATGADFMKSVNLLMLGETILPLQILDILSRVGGGQTGGSITLPATTTETLADHATPHLSKREQRVLQCLLDGRSNKAMARVIGIAESTVKVHVKAILRKIRAQNRTQAAIWAMNHGSSLWSADETPCVGEFDSLAGDISCTRTEARNGVRFTTPAEITEQATELTSLGVKRRSPLDVGETIRVLK